MLDRFERARSPTAWRSPGGLVRAARPPALRAAGPQPPTGSGPRRRLIALLEHKPWAADDGQPWIAAFTWPPEVGARSRAPSLRWGRAWSSRWAPPRATPAVRHGACGALRPPPPPPPLNREAIERDAVDRTRAESARRARRARRHGALPSGGRARVGRPARGGAGRRGAGARFDALAVRDGGRSRSATRRSATATARPPSTTRRGPSATRLQAELDRVTHERDVAYAERNRGMQETEAVERARDQAAAERDGRARRTLPRAPGTRAGAAGARGGGGARRSGRERARHGVRGTQVGRGPARPRAARAGPGDAGGRGRAGRRPARRARPARWRAESATRIPDGDEPEPGNPGRGREPRVDAAQRSGNPEPCRSSGSAAPRAGRGQSPSRCSRRSTTRLAAACRARGRRRPPARAGRCGSWSWRCCWRSPWSPCCCS